jgi:ribosome biogenesis protein BRX1
LEKDPLQPNGSPQTTLVEIGPRFVLTPIRIFEGAFGGATVFSNPGEYCPSPTWDQLFINRMCAEFVTPAATRQMVKRAKGTKYNSRKDAEAEAAERREKRRLGEDALGVRKVFSWLKIEQWAERGRCSVMT